MAEQTTEGAPSLAFQAPTFAALLPSSFLQAHVSNAQASSSSPTSFIRPSGRTATTFRTPAFHQNGLVHAHGSAVFRLGNTSVVATVMAEHLLARDIPNPPALSRRRRPVATATQPPSSIAQQPLATTTSPSLTLDQNASLLADLGLVIPNVELSTGCHPTQATGSAPSNLAQSLSHRLLETIHLTRMVPMSQLEIWGQTDDRRLCDIDNTDDDNDDDDNDDDDTEQDEQIVAFWTLYIDVLVLSLDGNPFDAIWTAVVNALASTRLPQSWWNRDIQAVLSDPNPLTHHSLGLVGFPISATFAIFDPRHEAVPLTTMIGPNNQYGKTGDKSSIGAVEGQLNNGKWILADPDALEESVCAERLAVIVDFDRRQQRFVLRQVSRHGRVAGSTPGGPEDVQLAADLAAGRWKSLQSLFVSA